MSNARKKKLIDLRLAKIAILVDEAAVIDADIKRLSADLKEKKGELVKYGLCDRDIEKSVKYGGDSYEACVTFSASAIKLSGDAEIERHRKVLGDRFAILFKESHSATGQRAALTAFSKEPQSSKRRHALALELADKLDESESDESCSITVKFTKKKGSK